MSLGHKSLPAILIHPWFEAQFYGDVTETGWRDTHWDGSPFRFELAQGLGLWCPCGFGAVDKDGEECYPTDLAQNKGRPHWLIIPFANPPSRIAVPVSHGPISRDGTRPRWTVTGSSLESLTLAPSINVGEPSCWHGFIRTGVVTS